MKRGEGRTQSAVALVLLGAGLLACASGPAPRDHFYRIHVAPPPAGKAVLEGVVEVERFGSDNTLRDRAMLKSEPGSHRVMPYTYHRWVGSPTLLLQRALADYLREAGIAERVTTPDAGATETWQVNGHLRRLDSVVDTPPRVHVEMELRLRRKDGADLVQHKIYSVEQTADDASPEAAARAFSLAVGTIFADFTRDVRSAVAR